jgi:hypothetical protein
VGRLHGRQAHAPIGMSSFAACAAMLAFGDELLVLLDE